MLKNLFFGFLLFMLNISFGQNANVKGTVLSNNVPVPYAKIFLIGTSYGAITDSLGYYEIEDIPFGSYKKSISATGFVQQKIDVEIQETQIVWQDQIEKHDLELNTVVVTGNMRETMISKSPVKIEVINNSFFKSNPVNSVIEALQTINGVQEQVNCGVCGTNDIHINGMEGPYTLVLIDGMPIVSGLSSVYGFNGIPTSMIDRVEIVKGPSSTLYGTEAVGGVINIITKRPEQTPLIDFEARFNTHQELKSSFAFAPKIGDRVFTSFSADYYYNDFKMDFNNDGFTDVPLNNRISIFNKWQVNDSKGDKLFTLAARYYNENRYGGVMNWEHDFQGSDSIYGENILTERFELIGSYVFPLKNKNLKLDFSANQHEQESYYGNVNYSAFQQVFFSNLIWTQKIKQRNYLLLGFTNNFQIYEDNTPSNTNERTYVPGIFVQDEFNWTENLVLLGGARLDFHKEHGFIFSPRLSLKQDIGSYTSFRLNYGTGFRQVHLFTEDHAFVSGARDVVILNELQPERSHNLAFNFNHTYTFLGYGNLDIDLFYTHFLNKIVPDFDYDPNLIVYDNLGGTGTTRGVSIAINHKFKLPLRLRTGITFMDVFESVSDQDGNKMKEQQFFAPRVSGTFGLSYDWKKAGITFNYNGRVMGPQRLPEFPDEFARPTESPWYSIQNFQITKTFKKTSLELFGGIKNVLNYTQPTPLIDPSNPYGDSFDTSYAYGPLQVRRFFFGLRWNMERSNK